MNDNYNGDYFYNTDSVEHFKKPINSSKDPYDCPKEPTNYLKESNNMRDVSIITPDFLSINTNDKSNTDETTISSSCLCKKHISTLLNVNYSTKKIQINMFLLSQQDRMQLTDILNRQVGNSRENISFSELENIYMKSNNEQLVFECYELIKDIDFENNDEGRRDLSKFMISKKTNVTQNKSIEIENCLSCPIYHTNNITENNIKSVAISCKEQDDIEYLVTDISEYNDLFCNCPIKKTNNKFMSKKITKNKYSIEKVFEDLRKKRITISYNGLVYVIDISKAEGIGNKSWGKIEYLLKFCDAKLIGTSTYKQNGNETIEKKPFIIKDCIMKVHIITKWQLKSII